MAFAGKTVVFVGAAGGIGFETSKQLLSEGVEKLAIFDIADPKNAVQQLKTRFPGRTIVFEKVNVRNEADVAKAFRTIVEQFKRVDIMINGAGIIDEKNVENTLGVNVVGVINGTQVALQHMSRENGGNGGMIVNIASVCGLDYIFSLPVYNASKYAVLGYTRTLADKYYEDKFGVTFVTMCPGLTATPLITDLAKRIYREDLVKDTVKFFNERGTQTTEACAKSFVDGLKKSKNGSIWMLDLNKCVPITLKPQWNLDME